MSTSQLDRAFGPMYGAVFFSTVMSTAFYGITCMQTFFYCINYHNDPLRIRSFVAVIWAFNTIHEGLIISGAYKYIMNGLANYHSAVREGVPELIIQILLTALVAIPTQGFFIYRIYVFSGKNLAAPLIWAPLAIYQLVSTALWLAKTLYIDHGMHVAKLNDSFLMNTAISYLSVAAAVDVLSAVSLTFLLVRKRAALGYSRTAHIMQRLAVFAINTGIWTALFALLTLILLHTHPGTLLYSVFGIPLCAVYCNTLLANLNVRAYIRDEIASQVDLPVTSTCHTGKRPESGKTQVLHMSEYLGHHGTVTFLDANRSEESENVV